jgi:hypothetical protein
MTMLSIHDHEIRQLAGQLIALHGEGAAGFTQQKMCEAAASREFQLARIFNVLMCCILALQQVEREPGAPLN